MVDKIDQTTRTQHPESINGIKLRKYTRTGKVRRDERSLGFAGKIVQCLDEVSNYLIPLFYITTMFLSSTHAALDAQAKLLHMDGGH